MVKNQRQKYFGLTDKQVRKSRQIYGSNAYEPGSQVPLWKRFLDRFRDPLMVILLAACLLSLFVAIFQYAASHDFSVFFNPIGIFATLLVVTALTFLFDLHADKQLTIIAKFKDEQPVTVYRNDDVKRIPRKEIVVGDIVILNTGEEVPADGELLDSVTLAVDESCVGGSSFTYKTTLPVDEDYEVGPRAGKVFRGSRILEGHGTMRVRAVGSATEMGMDSESCRIDDSVRTPLNGQLESLGQIISKISYGFAIAILLGRLFVYFSNEGFIWMDFLAYLVQTVMLSVTIIIVSVPEGLPMAVILSLVYNIHRMLKDKILVRRMHAGEAMGAATVVCTGQTGTLTSGRMEVAETLFLLTENEKNLIFEGMALNSTAQLRLGNTAEVYGNPVEGALMLWLRTQDRDYVTLRSEVDIIHQIPFMAERKYMATVVRHSDGTRVLYLKGAPELVYEMCSASNGMTRQQLDATLKDYQDRSLRTLGFACQILRDGEEPIDNGRLMAERLQFVGIVGISDPVREQAREAVKELNEAGVKIKIVTGEALGTAKATAHSVGLLTDGEDTSAIVTGADLAMLSYEELKERVAELKIVARALPADKKRIVEALQGRGETVAVTGDSISDVPAIETADIGISIGDGAEVAKEESDITVVDDSISTILKAVMWGRTTYLNLQRFLIFQLTVNAVACLIVLFGSFVGTDSPLTVTQMLWVNLIMDSLAAMAFSSLPPSDNVMMDNPRPRNAFVITRKMWSFIAGVGGVFLIMLLGLLLFFEHFDVTSLTDMCVSLIVQRPDTGLTGAYPGHLTPYELSLFFTIFVFLQFWNMFNVRAYATGGKSALNFRGCMVFGIIALAIVGGQIFIVELCGKFFNIVPLSFCDWLIIIVGTSLVLWVAELWRLAARKLEDRRNSAQTEENMSKGQK